MKILDRRRPQTPSLSHVDKILDYAERTPVFDTKSVIRLSGDKGYARLMLSRLLRAGKIKRVTKGYYTVHDDPSILVYCLKPAYLGLQDAMSFHNLWEQETNPIIITARKIRPGVRKVLGGNVIIRRLSPEHFFGYEYMKQGDLLLPVSCIEKTFIDMVYFREMRKETPRAFRNRIDRRKLENYLKRYERRFARKVLKLLN